MKFRTFFDINNNNVLDANECANDWIVYTVTVNNAPTVTCPSDITVNNDEGSCSAVVSYSPTITGVPAPGVTYTFTGATTGNGSGTGSGSTFNVGTTDVTITVTNGCGTQSCTFKVIVLDNTPPAIGTCPSNQTVYTGPGRTTCDQTATWTEPTAGDNCSTSIAYDSRSHAPGSTFPVGTTTVTYVFKDAAGNTTNCSFNITVIDNTAPVVSGCPGNITVNTGAGRTTCDREATWTPPTATDNCVTVNVSSTHKPG